MRLSLQLIFILFALSASYCANAETKPEKTLRWGITSGIGNGHVSVTNDTNRTYTDDYGLATSLGLYVEKSISPIFAATANIEFMNSLSPDINTASSSNSYYASIGGVLGRIDIPKSAYVSFAFGLSYIDLGDAGDPNAEPCGTFCFINLAGPYTQGGKGNGTGYRAAIGGTYSNQVRLEIAYSSLNGKGSDFPSNNQVEFTAWQFLVRIVMP